MTTRILAICATVAAALGLLIAAFIMDGNPDAPTTTAERLILALAAGLAITTTSAIADMAYRQSHPKPGLNDYRPRRRRR